MSDSNVTKIKGDKDLLHLREHIERLGTRQTDGSYAVKFGILLRDTKVAQTFEGLSATLKLAKSKNMLHYNSNVLTPTSYEDVIIVLFPLPASEKQAAGSTRSSSNRPRSGSTVNPSKSERRVQCSKCEQALKIPITATKFQCPKCEAITEVKEKNEETRRGSGSGGRPRSDSFNPSSSAAQEDDVDNGEKPKEEEKEDDEETRKRRLKDRMARLSTMGGMGFGGPLKLGLPVVNRALAEEDPPATTAPVTKISTPTHDSNRSNTPVARSATPTSTPGRPRTGSSNVTGDLPKVSVKELAKEKEKEHVKEKEKDHIKEKDQTKEKDQIKEKEHVKDVKDLTPIEALFQEIGLERYSSQFKAEGIQLGDLLYLDYSDIKELIPEFIHRQMLQTKIEEIRANGGKYVPKTVHEKSSEKSGTAHEKSSEKSGTALKGNPNSSQPSITPAKSKKATSFTPGSTSHTTIAPLFPTSPPNSESSAPQVFETPKKANSTPSLITPSKTTPPSSNSVISPSPSSRETELKKRIEELEVENRLLKDESKKEVLLLRAQIKTLSSQNEGGSKEKLEAEYERGKNEVLEACKSKLEKIKAAANTRHEEMKTELEAVKAEKEQIVARSRQFVQQVRDEKEKDSSNKEEQAKELLRDVFRLFKDQVQESNQYDGAQVLALVRKVLQEASKQK